MVNDGISQGNNYRRFPPKTHVKKKISLLLYFYNISVIELFSTSFHLGGPLERIRVPRPFYGTRTMTARMRNIWKKFKKWLQYHPEKNYLQGGKSSEKIIDN